MTEMHDSSQYIVRGRVRLMCLPAAEDSASALR